MTDSVDRQVPFHVIKGQVSKFIESCHPGTAKASGIFTTTGRILFYNS
jgi:hypothetical protein